MVPLAMVTVLLSLAAAGALLLVLPVGAVTRRAGITSRQRAGIGYRCSTVAVMVPQLVAGMVEVRDGSRLAQRLRCGLKRPRGRPVPRAPMACVP